MKTKECYETHTNCKGSLCSEGQLVLHAYLDSETREPAIYSQFDITIPGPFVTTDDMIRANRTLGKHYFDDSNMKAFKSRLYPRVFFGRFFIDSIQFVSSHGEKRDRQYKIRIMHDNGSTSNVVAKDSAGNWVEDFPTADSAKRAIRRLVYRKGKV